MKAFRFIPTAILIGGSLFVGCSQPTPQHPSEQATLSTDSAAALSGFKNDDPSLQPLLDKTVAYVIFPEVGKAGFIAGGSYGNGEVYEDGKLSGYADITQATFGLQAGAQTFSELVLFFKPEELKDFKSNQFTLSGNLSAVAIKAGAAGTADTSKGVTVFVRTKGGLMAEASVGGQRFRYQPLQAPATQPNP